MVLSGDLKRVEGMPVTIGQNLFEIAPLDEMVFEIAVPERDYAHVNIGRPLTIVLDTYPDKNLERKARKVISSLRGMGYRHRICGRDECRKRR